MTLIPPTQFQVDWTFGSVEDIQNRFSNCCCLGFAVRTALASFDLQVTPILPIEFLVNWPFSSGEDIQNRFSR